MAEEELADLHKAPAHTVVADKRCRYHFAAILTKEDACLAVVGFVRQQQVGKLFQAFLPFGVIRYRID